jgi:ATP-dependent DNA helicase RecQ
VARLLRLLDERRGDIMPLEQLRALIADLRGDEADSPGNRLVMEFLDDLGSAVGDEATPIAVVLDAAYEFLAEAERRSGEGLCLTTAHGAKGLEFDHVVVLDGGWRTTGEDALAERRLYYVAMTRARQTLALCTTAATGFADELTRLPAVLVRAPAVVEQIPAGLSRRFDLLGLADVDMDFAGRDRDQAIRRALAQLRIGDELVLEPLSEQARWAVLTRTGQVVGRTAINYQPPAGRIVTARVAAICVRRLRDVTAEWQARMAVDAWEVVLPELVIEPES